MAARPPGPATLAELNDLLEQFRDFYNHHRPHRALRGATPAEAFTATEKARPAERPLPAPVFVSRHTVGPKSGNLHRRALHGQRRTALGRTHCDIIRDGDHIAIFSGTTDSCANSPPTPPADYQPGNESTRNLPHPRTQTGIMSVSDVPRHKCQRCPETPQRADRS